MKTRQGFMVHLDKEGNRVEFPPLPHRGIKPEEVDTVLIGAGEEVDEKLSDELIHDLIANNPDYFCLERVDGNIVLSVEEKKKYNFLRKREDGVVVDETPKKYANEPTEMKIPNREWSEDKLRELYNKDGFVALKEVGKKFGVTDRSSNKLINEILRMQEELTR